MDSLLKKRIFPNHSIRLRPPTPHAPHQHICGCQMCKMFQHKKTFQLLDNQQQVYKQRLSSKLQSDFIPSSLNCNSQAFQWVLNRLLLPTHKMISRTIDLYIPQVVFYRDGQVSGLYKNREIDVTYLVFKVKDYRVRKVRREKINHTYLQKILNERRRKYREKIEGLDGERVVEKKKVEIGKKEVRKDTKDAAVLQYSDRSQQLITQNQLINLLLKRKQDGIWKKITMIKNFITCRQSTRIVKLSFNHTTPLYPQLFSRSTTLMLVYAQNILPQQPSYISQSSQTAFCLQLLAKSPNVFAQYYLYKMVSFIEYFYDDRIQQIDCTILINQLNRPYLIDVFHLQTMQLVKYSWTANDYRLKIQAEENRVFRNHKEIVRPDAEVIAKSNNIQGVMRDVYLREKDNYGLMLDQEDTTEDQFNDKFFAMLHPQIGINLSAILKDQQLTVGEFRKKFLNYKPQKKPLVKPFSSSLVKTLHILTPSLRKSPQKHRNNSSTKNQQSLPLKTFRSRRFSTIEGRFRPTNKTISEFY